MFGFGIKRKPQEEFVYSHFTGPGSDTREAGDRKVVYTHYCGNYKPQYPGSLSKHTCKNPDCKLVYCACCHDVCPKCGWWCDAPERRLAAGFALPGFYK